MSDPNTTSSDILSDGPVKYILRPGTHIDNSSLWTEVIYILYEYSINNNNNNIKNVLLHHCVITGLFLLKNLINLTSLTKRLLLVF